MARTRCYSHGKLINEDFPLDQVSEHLAKAGAVVWIDLTAPNRDELALLEAEMSLHTLAVEDAFEMKQRPKLDQYSDHSFLSAYQASFVDSTSGLAVHPIAAFITKNALVTVHPDKELDFAPIVQRWDASPELAKYGVSFLLHGLLDYLVDGYFDAVQSLDEQIEDLEGDLFEARSNQESVQRRTFALRKSLVSLRRVILPMREVVNTLMRRDLHSLPDEMGPYFQDVYDHVLRATEWTESLRDLVASILDANLAIQGNRLNIITKKVTGWAAIIAVPTLITGYFGQNVPYPGFSQFSGLVASTALMVVGVVTLFLVFRRNDWI